MPKYYCEYCDIYLTHSSPGGRRQHNAGRKHINNKIDYFMSLIRDPNFIPPTYIAEMGGGASYTGINIGHSDPFLQSTTGPSMIRPPINPQNIWNAQNSLFTMMNRNAIPSQMPVRLPNYS